MIKPLGEGGTHASAEDRLARGMARCSQDAPARGEGSVLVALWSTRSGTSSMITALNIAYEEEEKRSFIWLQIIAFGLTAGTVVFALVALALIAVLPAA